MSQNTRQYDFNDRVRRIEARASADSVASRARTKPKSRIGGSPRSRAILFLALFIGLLSQIFPYLVATYPEKFEFDPINIEAAFNSWDSDAEQKPELPFDIINAAFIPRESKIKEINKSRGPSKQLRSDGVALISPNVFYTEDVTPVVSQIVREFSDPDETTRFREVLSFARNSGCNVTRPSPSQKVIGVNTSNARRPGPLHLFDQGQVISKLTATLGKALSVGEIDKLETVDARVNIIDVFVTDQSAPLYLVLQSLESNILWNVQAAPGVEIARIVSITESAAAVVPPTRDTPVQALQVSDFVRPYVFGDDETTRSCMIRPWPKIEPSWGMANPGRNVELNNNLIKFMQGHGAFDAWFQDQFGVPAGDVTKHNPSTDHVLIGPIPQTPMPYRLLHDQIVYATAQDHRVNGEQDYRQRALQRIHMDVMRDVLNDNLAALFPPTIGSIPQ